MRFELASPLPLSELPESFWLAIARGFGAVLGSAVSLVYILPKGRREAAIRFVVGVSIGFLFGPATGLWLVDHLDLAGRLTRPEVVMTGAASASLCAWWALGLLRRMFESRSRSGPDSRSGK